MCHKKSKDITQWFRLPGSEWYSWLLLDAFNFEGFPYCLQGGRIHTWVYWGREKVGNEEWFLRKGERCFPYSLGIAYKPWINLLKYKTFRKISSLLFTFSPLLDILYCPPPSCIALVFVIGLDSWPWIRALPGGDCFLLHTLPVSSIFSSMITYVVYSFLGWVWWFVSSQRHYPLLGGV